jgi:flavin-binding protein dodecin
MRAAGAVDANASRQGHRCGCRKEAIMHGDHVYKILELVGTSTKNIEDAVQVAISRADETIRKMGWFEVSQIRGHIDSGKVQNYQVILKVGFTLEDK